MHRTTGRRVLLGALGAALGVAALSLPAAAPGLQADGAELVHRLLAQSMDKVRLAATDPTETYTNEFVTAR